MTKPKSKPTKYVVVCVIETDLPTTKIELRKWTYDALMRGAAFLGKKHESGLLPAIMGTRVRSVDFD